MLLNGEWQLTGKNQSGGDISVSATVPGCVHTDFIKNGIIKDIFYRDNSKNVQWIENNDYTYTRLFTVEALEQCSFLEFDGLDTYCDIFLNGSKIGEGDDMHIQYAFPVDGVLVKGENRLEVRFRSPIKEVEGLPLCNGAFTRERMRTRRIQCTYSWDWVDRFVTMGIYRDVRLVSHKKNEIDDIYIYTKDINPYSAQMALKINIRDFELGEDELHIVIASPDGKTIFEKSRVIIRSDINEFIDIPRPMLWYPNGYGEQPLYTLTVSGKNERIIKFGIRRLTILQLEDEAGSPEEAMSNKIRQTDFGSVYDKNKKGASFTLLCNNIKIMCKGADWVPCDPFPSNESPKKITRLLELGVNAGVNMLRIWGGGIFERDEFYNECDRLGILVTQDFLMACGTYPENEEWFINALQREAKCAALRLRNHSCLAWWSGDNENAVRGNENRTDFPGYLSATYGIEPMLRLYDPERYFLASSPYGGDVYASPTRGTSHNTVYLGYQFGYIRESDFLNYREYFSSYLARFNAEQSAIGMPFVSSLRKFLTDEDIFGDDTSMSEFHTKNNPGLGEVSLYCYVDRMTRKIFGAYANGEDRVRKMQMLHLEWTRLSLELFRRSKWYSSGIIYWMFDDCWPAANGWSFLDYYACPKPAYYEFRRCASPVVSSLTLEGNKLCVYASNDILTPVKGLGKAYIYDIISGAERDEHSFTFEIAENSAGTVYEHTCRELKENEIVICDISTDSGDDRSFLIPKRYYDLDITYGDYEITSKTDGEITVRANSFTPYTILDTPYLLEENCFLLKKGEEKTIKIIKALED